MQTNPDTNNDPRQRKGAARKPRGLAMLWTTFLMPMLMLSAAMAVEWGNISSGTARLQYATDAAARAAVIANTTGKSFSEVALEVYGENNVVKGEQGVTDISVEYGRWDTQKRIFEAFDPKKGVLETTAVRVSVEADIPTLLAGNAGVNAVHRRAEAVAVRPGVVLAVQNVADFKANDTAMLDFLNSINIPVRLISEDQLNDSCIVKGEVLFISSTVRSSRVDSSVVNVPGPVLVGETNLYDTFGFTWGADGQTHDDKLQKRHAWIMCDLSDLPSDLGWKGVWRNWWRNDKNYMLHQSNNRDVYVYNANNGEFDHDDACADDCTEDYEYHRKWDGQELTDKNGQGVYVHPGSGKKPEKQAFTDKRARTGYAVRDALGQEAVILTTMPNMPDLATTFWFDEGARMGNGDVTPYKRAGIFIRTSDKREDFNYTDEGYALLEQSIRWMLMNEPDQAILVK